MITDLEFIAKDVNIYHSQDGVDVSVRVDKEELRIILEQVIDGLVSYIGKESTMEEIKEMIE